MAPSHCLVYTLLLLISPNFISSTNSTDSHDIEQKIINVRSEISSESNEFLESFLEHLYKHKTAGLGDTPSSLVEIPFEDVARATISYLQSKEIDLYKWPGIGINEYLLHWNDIILEGSILEHCESLMIENGMAVVYEDFLVETRENATTKLNWSSEVLETIAMANICHIIEVNPYEILLIGLYDPSQLIEKIFTKKSNDNGQINDQIMNLDEIEDLLQTFMRVHDAYERLIFNGISEFQEYEDIAGYALIVGQLDRDKCSSGYINSLIRLLNENKVYLHLGFYLKAKIVNQASLCGMELDIAVKKTLDDADNSFVSTLAELKELVVEAAGSDLKVPLYLDIPDEPFMDSVITYINKKSDFGSNASLNNLEQRTVISEEEQQKIFELLGKPSIEIVERLERLLIFFFDLIRLINNLELETSQVIDKSTLDVMTEVNLSEKILTFPTN